MRQPEIDCWRSEGLRIACMKLHVRITFDDYREANRLHRVGSFWTRWSSRAILLVGGLFIIAGLMIFFFAPNETWRGLFPFLGGGLMVFSCKLLPVLTQRHEFGRNSCFQHESSLDISEESIRIDNPSAKSEHQWNSIRRWLENDAMFLLYTSPRLFMMLPKRAFEPVEADEFRKLLLRKLPANSGS